MSDRTGKLMLKALRMLEQDEQEEVLESLLAARIHAGAPQALGLPAEAVSSTLPDADRVLRLFGTETTARAIVEGRLKVLPVRLLAADYERLREWSGEQGFSMAVVIRTLLGRFLDEQHERSGA